jgi:PAS domain S-box-containing protein
MAAPIRGSFKRKLTLSTMLTSGVALLLAAAAFTTYEFVVFRRGMLADLERTAQMVGDNSSAALSFRDPASAQQTLGSLAANPHIVAAALYDERGEVFATYRPAAATGGPAIPAVRAEGHAFGEAALEVFHPIILRTEQIGTVYLASDLGEMRTRLVRYLWIVAGVLLASSLVALALAQYLHRALAGPLTELSAVATQVAAEKNYAARAAKRADDELGRLVEAFNEMLAQIQARDAALQRAHEQLEQRVESRTRQLRDEIAERLRSEAALRDSNRRFELVTRATSDVIWDWDIVTDHIWWNENHQRVFGAPPDEEPNFAARAERMHPDDAPAVKAGITTALDGADHLWSAEYRYRRGDGTYAHVIDRGYVLRSDEGEAVRMIGAMQDVSRARAAEAELRRAHRELVEASRQAGQAEVATSVLHNVGNVLNSVIVSRNVAVERAQALRVGYIAQLAALLEENRPALGGFFTAHPKGRVVLDYLPQLARTLEAERAAVLAELQAVGRNIEHIREIIARQQSFARVVGVLETVPLVEIVEQALAIQAATLAAHAVAVVREFSPVPAAPIDRHRVTQILINLIRNAAEALRHAEPPEGRRIRVSLACTEGRARICVADNGVGIAPENLTRIFQHGFTTRHDGHGFGLHSGAIAARDLGGSLSVTSAGSCLGAAFTLEFPLSSPPCSPPTTGC